MGEKTRARPSHIAYLIKYPSVHYILEQCSSFSRYPQHHYVIIHRPPSQHRADAAGSRQSLACPALPEDLLLYFLIKPLMQADIKTFLIHYWFKKMLVQYGCLWGKKLKINKSGKALTTQATCGPPGTLEATLSGSAWLGRALRLARATTHCATAWSSFAFSEKMAVDSRLRGAGGGSRSRSQRRKGRDTGRVGCGSLRQSTRPRGRSPARLGRLGLARLGSLCCPVRRPLPTRLPARQEQRRTEGGGGWRRVRLYAAVEQELK